MGMEPQGSWTQSEPAIGPEPTRRIEDRNAPRFALMLRVAKLVADEGEFLCIIRDISATGLKLKLFHRLPPVAKLRLELANGSHYSLVVVWEGPGEAGVRFLNKVDVEAFMAEASPFPKRPLRLRISLPARIRARDMRGQAIIHDISQHGARIESGARLAVQQPLHLEVPGMPPLSGWVRWRRHPEYGLAFEHGFRLEELAKHAGRIFGPGRPAAAMFTALDPDLSGQGSWT